MDAIEAFLAGSSASPRSLREYGMVLQRLEARLGKPLMEATREDLLRLNKALKEMRGGKQYATILRMFYKTADREDLRKLLNVKAKRRRIGPDDILTLPEVQRIIDEAHSLRDKALIATLWETGARIHEVLAITLGDVRREKGDHLRYHVWFRKAKIPGEEHEGYVIEAAPILARWLAAHPFKREEAPLFPTWDGRPLEPFGGGYFVIKRAVRRARIPKRVTPHTFRHSRATHLLRIGVPEGQVKKLLGWTPESPMLGRYSHLADRDAYKALLKGLGYEDAEKVDLGKLEARDLEPVVPMLRPRGVSPRPAGPGPDLVPLRLSSIPFPLLMNKADVPDLLAYLEETMGPFETVERTPDKRPRPPAQAPVAGDKG